MPGLSPGLLSAGLERCRLSRPISTSLRATGSSTRSTTGAARRAPAAPARGWWRAVVERADSAPADIVPGLLASTLEAPDRRSGERSERLALFRGRLGGLSRRAHKRRGIHRPPLPTVSSSTRAGRCRVARRQAARRRPADRDRAPAAGERPRRSRSGSPGRLRRRPDLRQHPHGRLRALDRPRPDDPASASGSRASQMSGQPIRAEGARRRRRGRIAGRPARGRSPRRGPVIGLRPAGLARVRSRWRCCEPRRGLARSGCGWSGSRVVYLPLTLLPAPRSSRAGGRAGCWSCSARRCSRRLTLAAAARLPGARVRLRRRPSSPTRST